MEKEYVSLAAEGTFSFEDRKSRFLSFARPVSEEAEAVAFVKEIRSRYPDARHCVYAYVLRAGNTTRYSDDSEPQTTAGLPTLDVLRKRGITDAAVATVRYFGGVLLGTGGLVHAYSTAAAGAAEAAGIVSFRTYVFADWTFSYADFQKVPATFGRWSVAVEDTVFSDRVTLSVSVPADAYENWKKQIVDVTCARAEEVAREEKFVFRK